MFNPVRTSLSKLFPSTLFRLTNKKHQSCASPVLCEGNPPITVEFPSQRDADCPSRISIEVEAWKCFKTRMWLSFDLVVSFWVLISQTTLFLWQTNHGHNWQLAFSLLALLKTFEIFIFKLSPLDQFSNVWNDDSQSIPSERSCNFSSLLLLICTLECGQHETYVDYVLWFRIKVFRYFLQKAFSFLVALQRVALIYVH